MTLVQVEGDSVATSELFIGGRSAHATGERWYETTEAITGEPIAKVAAATVEDARAAVDAAAAALPAWAGRTRRSVR